MLQDIFWLLVAFQVKHFWCDFPLQTQYMLGKFKEGLGFIGPLTAHCLVHVIGTFVITVIYLTRKDLFSIQVVVMACAFDFIMHFAMDRIKASPNILGKFQPLSPTEYHDLIKFEQEKGPDAQTEEDKRHNRYFWLCLGLDQKIHHLTHYIIIYNLVEYTIS